MQYSYTFLILRVQRYHLQILFIPHTAKFHFDESTPHHITPKTNWIKIRMFYFIVQRPSLCLVQLFEQEDQFGSITNNLQETDFLPSILLKCSLMTEKSEVALVKCEYYA